MGKGKIYLYQKNLRNTHWIHIFPGLDVTLNCTLFNQQISILMSSPRPFNPARINLSPLF